MVCGLSVDLWHDGHDGYHHPTIQKSFGEGEVLGLAVLQAVLVVEGVHCPASLAHRVLQQGFKELTGVGYRGKGRSRSGGNG